MIEIIQNEFDNINKLSGYKALYRKGEIISLWKDGITIWNEISYLIGYKWDAKNTYVDITKEEYENYLLKLL